MYVGLYLNGRKLADVTGFTKRKLFSEICLGLLFALVSVAVAGLIFVLLAQPPHKVDQFLPKTATDLAMFMPLALTAGFCEGTIFRGYLVKQFYGITKMMPAALGIQATLFGFAHGYHQTLAEFAAKFAFGLLMGILADWRKGLTACIVAHASSDVGAGILSVLLG